MKRWFPRRLLAFLATAMATSSAAAKPVSKTRATAAGGGTAPHAAERTPGTAADAAPNIPHSDSGESFAEAAPAPGSARLRLPRLPGALNPIVGSDAAARTLDPFLFASLLDLDEGTLAFRPYLAKEHVLSADGKRAEFTLDPNAKWSDGSPVTAADLQFSFDLLQSRGIEARALKPWFEGVRLESLPDGRLLFTFEKPGALAVAAVATLFRPIQKKQFERETDITRAKGLRAPATSGPYLVKAFEAGSQIVLAKDPAWWAGTLPSMAERYQAKEFSFHELPTDAEAFLAFQQKRLDVLELAPEQFGARLRGKAWGKIGRNAQSGKALWAAGFESAGPRSVTFVGWNHRNPLFQSVKVRTALASLADVKQIREKIFHGTVEQASSFWGSFTRWSDPDLRKPHKLIVADRRKALALLKEEGWTDSDKNHVLDKLVDGKRVEFRFALKVQANHAARKKMAAQLRENLRAAGIVAQVEEQEWEPLAAALDKREFDAALLAWTGESLPHPARMWHSRAAETPNSPFGFGSGKLDELLEKADAAPDLEQRAQALREASALFYVEQPVLLLTEPKKLYFGFTDRVKAKDWLLDGEGGPAIERYSFGE